MKRKCEKYLTILTLITIIALMSFSIFSCNEHDEDRDIPPESDDDDSSSDDDEEDDDECEDADGDTWCIPQDCADNDPFVNPGMAEDCNDGFDNDCNTLTDEDDPACEPSGGTDDDQML